MRALRRPHVPAPQKRSPGTRCAGANISQPPSSDRSQQPDGPPPAGRTLCAPTSPFLSRARAPAGRSADMGAATTLSRCGGCATRGFPAVRNTTTRAFGPPWFLFLTPVHPRCSARLRASRCHAAARARPGRFRCDSGWSPGRLAALCSPLLRSKLPCARPPRFSLTGAFPAPPSAPRIPACPAAHTYCSYRPPRRAG